jgi:hypothetical protein
LLHARRCAAAFLLSATVAAGCTSGGTPVPATQAPPSTSSPTGAPGSNVAATTPGASATIQSAVEILDRAQVGCKIAKAYVGDVLSPSLTLIGDCHDPTQSFLAIGPKGLVATDGAGEAEVVTDRCGHIYVFQASQLSGAPCNASVGESGRICLANGTMTWQGDCNGTAMVVTPSAALSLLGTWVAATYLPDSHLTLFTVFEGKAVATAFSDPGGQSSAGQTELGPSTFWFSAPDGGPTDVAGLAARTSHGFDQLPGVIHALHVETWFAAIRARAISDRVDPSALPTVPVLDIRMGGGPLDTAGVRDALLWTMNWSTVKNDLFGDGIGDVVELGGTSAPRSLADRTLDFPEAKQLLEGSGQKPFALTVVTDDPSGLASIAKQFASSLGDIGLKAQLRIFTPDEAEAAYTKLVSQGEPVVWLSNR